jgi:flagellar protein FliS
MDKPQQAYAQNRTLGWARIDMILAVFDGIMDQLKLAKARLAAGEAASAQSSLARAQLGVAALATGTGGDGHDLSADFRRLYEFVSHRLSQGDAGHIDDAFQILRTLREGFAAVQNQARELERTGAIRRPGPQHLVEMSA